MTARAALVLAALSLLAIAALPASAMAQSVPFAPWDGTNPFNCVEQDVGTGTAFPDPAADPFCVKFDKTNQNVTDFGIVEFTAQEPARVAAAGTKCFYHQHDEWTGSIVQGSEPEVWHWVGNYFFDRAKGLGGVSVREFRIGGTPFAATPFVPPEYAEYFDEAGGGGVIVTQETEIDPSCIAKVDTEEERATVYGDVPDFGNCVAPGGKIRAIKVGRARLGATREAVAAKVGVVERSSEDRDVWCVVGGGAMSVRFRNDAAAAIRTTTAGHSIRGVGPGDSAGALRKVGFERLGGGEKSTRFGLPGDKLRPHDHRRRPRRHGDLAEDDRGLGLRDLPATCSVGGVSSDQRSAPYFEALAAYAARKPGRFHIPGHKGGPGADPEMVAAFGPAAFAHDIPSLIEGIDIGAEPTPFEQAQELAAEAWGAQRSWFLINGASQGNHAGCLAVRQTGDRVVVQRNVHSSVIDGLVLAGLEPEFAAPEIDPELGLAHCLTPDALAEALDRAPDAVAAFVVSPTYFGAVADVAGLAEVAHERGVPLFCDEAWGAHLRFSERLPDSALSSGADVIVSSVHKIVGSLTQSAILHLGEGARIDGSLLDRAVTLTESTSPSALLGGSLDAARRHIATCGERLLDEIIDLLADARERVREIPGLDVLDERLQGARSVAGWDPMRLSIDVRGTGRSGHRIADAMREADDINLEMASENVVVAVFGLGEQAPEEIERLLGALGRAVETLGAEPEEVDEPLAPPPPWGPLRLLPRRAFLSPQETVPFEDAEGRIAAESLAAYPPGIPNVLPGELLTAETLSYIRESVEHGGKVRGAADRSLKTIRVVAE